MRTRTRDTRHLRRYRQSGATKAALELDHIRVHRIKSLWSISLIIIQGIGFDKLNWKIMRSGLTFRWLKIMRIGSCPPRRP